MGIFSKKEKEVKVEAKAAPKKTTKVVSKAAPKAKVAKPKAESTNAVVSKTTMNNSVIIRPRITEKATLKADKDNVFVFEITDNATKQHVKNAVSAIYNVVPTKVAIVRNPSKNIFYRGRAGTTSGVKKAYVYLKKGDKIEIV